MLTALENPEVRRLLRPISIEEYYKLFGNEKTELIEGMVYYKMPKSAKHAAIIALLSEYLRRILSPSRRVMSENPVQLVGSEPEPDIAIVEPLKSWLDPHPTFADLIVEISITTQAFDASKATLYAKAGIPVYWNILPEERVTIEYSEPAGHRYLHSERRSFDEELTFTINDTRYALRLTDILLPRQ